jgi:hypothetical protein
METIFLENTCICWECTLTPKQNNQLYSSKYNKTNRNNYDSQKLTPYKFNPDLNKKMFIA